MDINAVLYEINKSGVYDVQMVEETAIWNRFIVINRARTEGSSKNLQSPFFP